MEDLLENATRCPHCRAATRPGAPWCSLCHADLRPVPAAGPLAAPAFDPLTAPAHELGLTPAPAQPTAAPAATPSAEPSWPCATCGAANRLTFDACSACGAGFLAGLREADGPLLELPVVGDLTRLSRAQRLMLALGVVLAVLALTAGLGLLLS